jgi:hypothetical protein
MDLTNTSWLNNDWLAKVAEKRRERHAKVQKPGAPPASVQDKRDEDSARLKAMKAHANAQFDKAVTDYPSFAKFMSVVEANENTFKTPIPGVLDADLAELAAALHLYELPHAIRCLIVHEVHACVRRVNRRCWKSPDDEIPWCLPKGTRFTTCEIKDVLEIFTR